MIQNLNFKKSKF